jgi:dTMP kinase
MLLGRLCARAASRLPAPALAAPRPAAMAAAAAADDDGPAPPPPPPRGAFIVFEGADRAGKSTQVARLAAQLTAAGVRAEAWRFPERSTAVGGMIDAYLKSAAELDDAAVHLLFSANRWERRAALLAALGSGTTLIVDRYAYSGVAFTAAKRAPGLGRAWCAASDVGLPAPDAVFFLDLAPEEAARRGGFGEERYETTAMQAAVAEEFAALRAGGGGAWRVFDAGQGVEALAAEIAAAAAPVIAAAAAGAPLGRLWDGAPLEA